MRFLLSCWFWFLFLINFFHFLFYIVPSNRASESKDMVLTPAVNATESVITIFNCVVSKLRIDRTYFIVLRLVTVILIMSHLITP